MSHLFIVRHGVAFEHGTPGMSDDDRPLTEEGAGKVRDIAKALKKLDVEPGLIATSPLPRARQTAEIVARVLGSTDRLQDVDVLRTGSSADAIREWVRTRREERLMIVGHNPAFEELVGLYLGLLGRNMPFELKKGGVAAFSTEDHERYKLNWLATPALLRKLSRQVR